MDLVSIAKIIEISPIIGLAVVFSFIVYKMGTGYVKFVNRILDQQSGDVKNLRADINGNFQKVFDTIKEHNEVAFQKMEIIVSKLDNFRQIVVQEFNEGDEVHATNKEKILTKIDELKVEILRAQLSTPSSSSREGK